MRSDQARCVLPFPSQYLLLGLLTALIWLTPGPVRAQQAVTGCNDIVCIFEGPRLASVDSTQGPLLDAVFTALLGNSVMLAVLDWNALATADVSLLEVLEVLQTDLALSSTDEVLLADISLAQLVSGMAHVAGNNGDVATESVLNALALTLPPQTIPIGDLLQIDTFSGYLTNVDISVLDLLLGAVQLYNSENVLVTPTPVVLSGSAITAILGVGTQVTDVTLQLQVVEPPIFVCGPEGTTFHTGNVRMYLDIDIVETGDTGSVSIPLVADVDVEVSIGHIDLYLDVARGIGTIDNISFDPTTSVTVSGTPGVVDAYFGQFPGDADMDGITDFFDRDWLPVDNDMDGFPDDLVHSVVGEAQITVDLPASPDIELVDVPIGVKSWGEADSGLQSQEFVCDEVDPDPDPQSVTFGSSATSVSTLISELINNLDVDVDVSAIGIPLVEDETVDLLVGLVQGVYNTAIDPILVNLMTDLADPMLGMLGIGIGEMDVIASCPVPGIADWGDAPDGYQTLNSSNGARHCPSPLLYLGVEPPDLELDGQPTSPADGDNQFGVADEDSTILSGMGPDDGDGVVEPGQGETVVYTTGVRLTNRTGADAALVGWVDVNCNGVFDEPAERSRTIIDGDGVDSGGECMLGELIAPGEFREICPLQWGVVGGTVPLMTNAQWAQCPEVDGVATTYARLRLTTEPEYFTDASPSPNGPARDGEVEDYALPTDVSATPAIIGQIDAAIAPSGSAVVSWLTGAEPGSAAFRLERLQAGRWQRVHRNAWIPARLDLQGGAYRVIDRAALEGVAYRYRVIEQSVRGPNRVHGPFEVTVAGVTDEPAAGADFDVQGRLDVDRTVEVVRARSAMAKAQQFNADRASLKKSKGGGNAPVGGNAPPALRIQVAQSGIHGLSVAELASHTGANASKVSQWLSQGRFALSSRGQAIPWTSLEDRLVFFGQGPDDHYSHTRTYWLQAKQPGMVMAALPVDGASHSLSQFHEDIDFEQDAFAFTSVTDDVEADYWFWNFLMPVNGFQTRVFELEAPGALADAGTVSVRLWGAAEIPHVVEVAIEGGALLGTIQFNGVVPHEASLPVPAGALTGGSLRVELTVLLSPSGINGLVLVDGLGLQYARENRATGDQVAYPAAGASSMGGFSTDTLLTLDITSPGQPVVVQGGAIVPDGAEFAFAAVLPAARYATSTPGAVLAPEFIGPDQPSNLRDADNAANYVIISHAELMSAAHALSDYRSGALQSMVVDVQDIYDEFSHGEPRPAALQGFAAASQSWQVSPRYFVIMGDGSFDYRDILGTGYNFVAPQMWNGPADIYAGDALLGDLDGDGIPEVSFGRIPAKNPEEGLEYVDKLAAFEAMAASVPTLLLADNGDAGGDFAYSTILVREQVQDDVIYLGLQNGQTGAVRTALFNELDAGVGLVNYLGHGGVDRIAAEGLITLADVDGLQNSLTPALVGLSCLVNNFSIPGWDSLGERLVMSPQGGMVASWAASGESFNDQATSLGVSFHQLQGQHERLGDAILAATRVSPGLVQVYVLLGDPALRLP